MKMVSLFFCDLQCETWSNIVKHGRMSENCSESEDDGFCNLSRFASVKLAGFQSYCRFTHKLVLRLFCFLLIQFNLTQGLC